MNQINVIAPYKYHGEWVFDDPTVGLVKEAFVAGADTVMDFLARGKEKFVLRFSGEKFPGATLGFKRAQEEAGGWWYYHGSLDLTGWLCPALFRYFDEAPEEIWVEAVV